MKRSSKILSFLFIILVALTLTIPDTINASSDPSLWPSKPTNHYISGLSVTDPEYAYDGLTGTCAEFSAGVAGRFEVVDFTTGAQTYNDVIGLVDLYMWYDIPSGGKCEYRIWFYVSSSYEASPAARSILKGWSQDAGPAGAAVWKDVKDPNDLTWSWDDIENIRVVVEVGNCGTGGAKTFEEYEVWANVYYYNAVTLYVDPASTTKNVDETFSININITGFTAGNWSGGVYGWELKLGYNGTLLNSTSVTQGTYLSSAGSTYFNVLNHSDALGLIWATCTLLADIHGQNGSGTLATIGFKVKTTGNCTLDLYDTKVSGYDYPNKRVYAISHTAVDGSFETPAAVPEFPYGAALEIGAAAVIVYVWWARRRKGKLDSSSQPPPFSLTKSKLKARNLDISL